MNAVTPQRKTRWPARVIPDLPAGDGGSEAFLPSFIDNIDNLMAKRGVSDEHIVMRVTGCPNGSWSRDAGGSGPGG